MPGQGHGFDNTISIAKEATYGTAPTTGHKWAGIVESFEPEENLNADQRLSIGKRGPLMIRAGAKEVDGSMTLAMQNGLPLVYGLGAVATSGDATAGYTHTITPVGANTELPSFTVHNNNANLGLLRNYSGGKIDSFTVTAEAEEAVMFEADMLFKDVTDVGTAYAVAAELSPYYMFYEGTVKINNVNVTNVTAFELEVSNNLERRFTVNGSKTPIRIEEGNLEIAASMTMDFTDKTQWDLFKSEGSLAVSLVLADPTNAKRSITFNLTGGLYDTNAIAVGAEDLQEQEMEAVFTDINIVVKDPSASTLV